MMIEIDEPIEIVAYDQAWPQLFESETTRLRGGLSEEVEFIEHIGSTSVYGMAGKPIIDLLIGTEDIPHAYRLATEIENLGYENLGEAMVPGRLYLRRRGERNFNVVIVVRNGELWRRLIELRDYLRAHPDEVVSYTKSKMHAVALGATTFLSYSREKGPFLMGLAERAARWGLSRT